MMLGLIGDQIKIKSSRFQTNPWGGEFLLRGAHLAMIELTSCCIRVIERGWGDLPYERCHLPPLVPSSSHPIISKSSNTWQIRPLGVCSHFSYLSEAFFLILDESKEPLLMYSVVIIWIKLKALEAYECDSVHAYFWWMSDMVAFLSCFVLS